MLQGGFFEIDIDNIVRANGPTYMIPYRRAGAARPELMKVRLIKVCTKAGMERSPGHKKHVFVQIFKQFAWKK